MTGPSLIVRERLDVPVTVAWDVLCSSAGARRWLGDPKHPGIMVGASLTLPTGTTALITSVSAGASIELETANASLITIRFIETDKGSELAVTEARSAQQQSATSSTVSGDPTEPNPGWRLLLTDARFLVEHTVRNRSPRQAILVIHGMGSQRPSATIERFTDALVGREHRWSKPDQLSSSYELHRYQFKRTSRRPRTDVYELYWADKVPGTKLGHIGSWLRRLLVRPPNSIGSSLRPVWWTLIGGLACLVIALVVLTLTISVDGVQKLWGDLSALGKIGWVSAALGIVGTVLSGVLIASLGDVARYLDNAPGNIAVRQSIRESGIAMLRQLHTCGKYDRIVVVGHSLGSVIAYDLLHLYWSQVSRQHGSPLVVNQEKLSAYKKMLVAGRGAEWHDDTHRTAQRDLWTEYRRLGHPWIVTDLVTVGSPLTHAQTLLARSAADLKTRMAESEIPVSPPTHEMKDLTTKATYVVAGQQRSMDVPVHGVPFILTRWTNIYIPTKAFLFGDPVAGPLANVLGQGIRDVPVTVTPWWHQHTPAAHTSYWQRTKPGKDSGTAILALHNAIGLDSAKWLRRHVDQIPWSVSVAHDPAGDR